MTKSFLGIENIETRGNVNIMILRGSSKDVTVDVSGDRADSIKLTQNGSTLAITAPDDGGGSTMIINSDGNRTVINYDRW